jgi:hypothetical protein
MNKSGTLDETIDLQAKVRELSGAYALATAGLVKVEAAPRRAGRNSMQLDRRDANNQYA